MLKNTHYHKEVTHKSMQKILLTIKIIYKIFWNFDVFF